MEEYMKKIRNNDELLLVIIDQQNSGNLANPTSYKDVFFLPINFDQIELEIFVKHSFNALTNIAKYTKILGENYDSPKIKNLMKDDTAILVGALLLKFTIILVTGRPVVVNLVSPNDKPIDPNNKDYEKRMKSQYNHCLPLKILHSSIGCIPNVDHVPSHGNKSLLCAIRPIKAGDQLIMFEASKSIWNRATKTERRLEHGATYKTPCECIACTDWSEILDDDTKLVGIILKNEMSYNLTWELWEMRNTIILEWKNNFHKQNFPDIKMLQYTIDFVTVVWRRMTMPSALIIKSVYLTTNNYSSSSDFSNYKSIFTLPIYDLQLKEYLQGCVEDALTALIGLAKYTKILGNSYDFDETKKLMKDSTAILAGALLLQFTITLCEGFPMKLIFFVHPHLVDPNGVDYKNGEKAVPEQKKEYNYCTSFLLMHTLSGCVPNVDYIYTYGNKFVLYAIRPIKAGDQLISESKSRSIWSKDTKVGRDFLYKQIYGFSCECQACEGSWTEKYEIPSNVKEQFITDFRNESSAELWIENDVIVSTWRANCNEFDFPNDDLLLRSRDLVKKACEELSMPSLIVNASVRLLMHISKAFYDPSELYAKVPHFRKQEIGRIIIGTDDVPSDLFPPKGSEE
ncbi:hypothetical protein QAD02_011343 [Eretmocerus hayati]|uniref:Uncharacterized protein n=1 Tax=Eretmocerus hayati TaxID=131215 RepID=A0ACC2NWS9_9HYME|nr:hypothetical protein QAD02_011343 [Eretmocerus hayati]